MLSDAYQRQRRYSCKPKYHVRWVRTTYLVKTVGAIVAVKRSTNMSNWFSSVTSIRQSR
jgi:hypothetical protein